MPIYKFIHSRNYLHQVLAYKNNFQMLICFEKSIYLLFDDHEKDIVVPLYKDHLS